MNSDYHYWIRRGDRWNFVTVVFLVLGTVGFVASVCCGFIFDWAEWTDLGASVSALVASLAVSFFGVAARECYGIAHELMITKLFGGGR